MKALLCPALLVAATTSGSMAQAIATNKYISFLNKFRQDHAESVLKDSPAILEPFYADSIRLMPPFQKTMEGKKAAVAYYKAFTNRFIIHEFSKREIEILDLNKQLMEIGTLTLQITSKDTGKKYQLIGKYMDLWHIGTDANPNYD